MNEVGSLTNARCPIHPQFFRGWVGYLDTQSPPFIGSFHGPVGPAKGIKTRTGAQRKNPPPEGEDENSPGWTRASRRVEPQGNPISTLIAKNVLGCRKDSIEASFVTVRHRRCRPAMDETDSQSMTNARCPIHRALFARWVGYHEPQPPIEASFVTGHDFSRAAKGPPQEAGL
jgi:hypothetical protein